jgi:transposase
MKKQYTSEFKAQVVKEFLRERKTLSQLASEHGVHQTVIADWRDIVLKGLPGLFEKGRSDLDSERAMHEKQTAELYVEIGKMVTQVAWLKKKAGIRDE